MTSVIDINAARRSRRQLITGLALFAGAAGAAGILGAPAKGFAGPSIDPQIGRLPVDAQGRAPLRQLFAVAGAAACKVVSGRIAPTGWCSIYAKKS